MDQYFFIDLVMIIPWPVGAFIAPSIIINVAAELLPFHSAEYRIFSALW